MATSRSASGTLRGFILAGVGFFVLWQVAVVLKVSHRAAMTVAIYGFVFHIVFGKGYALIPAYFDRQLITPWAPWLHLPLSVTGTVVLAFDRIITTSGPVEAVGATAWGIGAAVFVTSMLATLGWNVTGSDTGTGGANADRQSIDRFANRFVPIVLGYFVLGSYETVALATPAPRVIAQVPAQVSHLLAAGTAGLLVLAIGARLLPRFFVADPIGPLIKLMLLAGALGPATLVLGFGGGVLFRFGAVFQVIALGAYAIVIVDLFRQSDRRRVGLYSIVLGAIAGIVGVALGISIAFGLVPPATAGIHHRWTLVGFLGLTIIGVLFQFYPPGVGTSPGVSDRTAIGAFALIASGVLVETAGFWVVDGLVMLGQLLVLGGGILATYVMVGLVYDRGLR